MAGVLKFCPVCKEENNEPWFGYYPFMSEDALCSHHSIEMKTVNISMDDYITILSISHDVTFLEVMIDLKEADPIEYQLKMSQFRNQVQQQKQAQTTNTPHCPICNSTNIKKISGTERATSIVMLGIFSKKINKGFKCANCGATF